MCLPPQGSQGGGADFERKGYINISQSGMSLLQATHSTGYGEHSSRDLGAAEPGKNPANPVDNPIILLCHLGMMVEAIAFMQGDMFWLRVCFYSFETALCLMAPPSCKRKTYSRPDDFAHQTLEMIAAGIILSYSLIAHPEAGLVDCHARKFVK